MSQLRIRLLDQMSRLAEETGSAVVLVGGERRLPWNQDYHVTIHYDKSYYYDYIQIILMIMMNVTGHINFYECYRAYQFPSVGEPISS